MFQIEITKDHVGRCVYGLPTGNNARRGVGRQEPVEFHIVKVGRRYAEVIRDGFKSSHKIDCKTGARESAVRSGYGVNAGYMFFGSLDDVVQHQARRVKVDKIRQSLNHHDWESLSDDTLDAIAKDLGIH